MAPTPELRILCFGASITAGSYNFGLNHHPYATRLKYRLQSAHPSHRITVDIDGLPGDSVKGGEYSSRLATHFNNASRKYDWLIFQGGGNDLLKSEEEEEEPTAIFDEMQKLWHRALHSGGAMKIMALTVTDTEDQRARTRERYSQLNLMITNHQQEHYFVADVFSRIPYADMPKNMREKVWDDGLHFKPAGYDMLGDAVADRLLEILEAASPQQQKL
ncbi:MAG: hypothetical protein Q9186_003017 [Xanthomendoza sp. 1 TL-2023]